MSAKYGKMRTAKNANFEPPPVPIDVQLRILIPFELGGLLVCAPGAETPTPILGEESCSQKVSGDVAGIKSLRIRETNGNEGIHSKVGGGVSAPGAVPIAFAFSWIDC